MSDAEARAYLREQCKVVVATNGADGMPHIVPMHYGVDAADRLIITTFAKSQKVRNLERIPRATLLVESGVIYDEIRAVLAYCDAEILSDVEQVRTNMALVRTDGDVMTGPIMAEQVRASITKRVVVRFTPYRIVSWDHSKLGLHY